MCAEPSLTEKRENLWRSLFHHLWSRDVGREGYVKQEWRDLETLLLLLSKVPAERHTQGCECVPCLKMEILRLNKIIKLQDAALEVWKQGKETKPW